MLVTVEGVIAQIASSEVRIRFLGAPILSKQLHTAGGQKASLGFEDEDEVACALIT